MAWAVPLLFILLQFYLQLYEMIYYVSSGMLNSSNSTQPPAVQLYAKLEGY